MAEFIKIDRIASTNTYVKEHVAELPQCAVVYTPWQTAGRGQKGNSWEAEPGMNLTFSLLVKRPNVDVKKQFVISEAVSMAIVETLRSFAGGFTVKWPNDIYYHDSKIAGILIENSLADGVIDSTVIGIGLNVNQQNFVSDAPNPVSLTHITGEQHNTDDLLRDLVARLETALTVSIADVHATEKLHKDYLTSLYRNDREPHLWQLPDDSVFEATILDVRHDGTLVLRHADGETHGYAFKEVKHLINNELAL